MAELDNTDYVVIGNSTVAAHKTRYSFISRFFNNA